jgi:hypothetical protein
MGIILDERSELIRSCYRLCPDRIQNDPVSDGYAVYPLGANTNGTNSDFPTADIDARKPFSERPTPPNPILS